MAATVSEYPLSQISARQTYAGGKRRSAGPAIGLDVIFRSKERGRDRPEYWAESPNLTAIRAAAKPSDVFAFDTGPGNMVVIDRLMQMLFNKSYDRAGAVARAGKILQPVLEDVASRALF